jgi:hypothetical protein
MQCLNTILPVTNYFLTGAYKDHVNTSNPLGMGGKLARTLTRQRACRPCLRAH